MSSTTEIRTVDQSLAGTLAADQAMLKILLAFLVRTHGATDIGLSILEKIKQDPNIEQLVEPEFLAAFQNRLQSYEDAWRNFAGVPQ